MSPGILPGIPWVFRVWVHSVASCFSSCLYLVLPVAVKTTRSGAVWSSEVQGSRVKSPPLAEHSHSAPIIDPFVQPSQSSRHPRHIKGRQRDGKVWVVLYMKLKFKSDFLTQLCRSITQSFCRRVNVRECWGMHFLIHLFTSLRFAVCTILTHTHHKRIT